ncbi:Serine protease Do-like HtrB [Granulosicoccus antarcticus IMCC3135]|uniref:Serine protease Do-like HtrB n=1 Tax=Granulosicoccus antarcticus IMCC3135 TaxID=1192854 RepID=A0A2Z2NMI2_9GAMM|nr:Serine protease Do-like HtrB [Granulosicoccus antarcticus IMCC3135]
MTFHVTNCQIAGKSRQLVLSLSLLSCLFGSLGVSILPSTAQAASEEDNWARTVSRVADSVVSLQLSQLRNFDDNEQGGSSATGFVVDAERGIILTNRHVVGSGPIRISATFQNQERVDAVPLYRDPIHDFGFIRYKPADLKYATPESLQLRPEKVSTGMNIRVIGSDGGEQLSILPGTIARLDREVPSYGRYGYNDFNTFYLQAASGTSGGSSGSPVIDLDGDVVALNAAANTKTASSFFLPLARIQYALKKLQANEPIDRGGFETLFEHQPFRELRRLGLDEDTESLVRATNYGTTGMLTVEQVITGGIADGLLQPGDILVSIDKAMVTDFLSLETLLDASIEQTLEVELIRQGERTTSRVSVVDLNALAPHKFLELGDTILQNMSIQHARAMNLPRKGVIVMRPGYALTSANVPQGALITELEDMPIEDIDGFLAALNQSRNKDKKRVRYIVPGREFSSELAQIQIDTHWFGQRACTRVDDVRFWDCSVVTLAEPEPDSSKQLVSVPNYKDALLDKVAPAMVHVDFDIPYSVDNVYARHFKGVGIVIDKQAGLVAVDRNTVPIALGDVELTFFGSLVVPATVVFLHPRHNVALVQYDASLLADAQFDALTLSELETELPQNLTMVGYRADGTFRRHAIDDISHLTIGFSAPGLPRFQQASLDVYGVPNVPPSLGGPLVDENGDVHAVYMSFAYEKDRQISQREWAMPAAVIRESLRMYRSQQPYYSLDAHLSYQPLSLARQYGLPDSWLLRYNELPSEMRRVLSVSRQLPDTDAAEKLRSGDVLLAIDGELVSELFVAETLSQRSELELTILRAGKVIQVLLKPSMLDTRGTQRIVSWAGATFENVFSDIAYQKSVSFPGVYIADTEDGSPALWDSLYRNRFVVAVDGSPVNDLDDFLTLVSQREQDQITRLTVVSMSGRKQIVTVQPEYNFWPTFEVSQSPETGWQRIEHGVVTPQ